MVCSLVHGMGFFFISWLFIDQYDGCGKSGKMMTCVIFCQLRASGRVGAVNFGSPCPIEFGQPQTQGNSMVCPPYLSESNILRESVEQFGSINGTFNFTRYLCNDHLNIDYLFIYIIYTNFTVIPGNHRTRM